MFSHLGNTLRNLAKSWQETAVFRDKDIDKALKDVHLALLDADVSLQIADDFVQNMREQLQGEKRQNALTVHQSIIQSVFHQIKHTLGEQEPLKFEQKLSVFSLLGLQGVGKTTTAAKLALHLKQKNKKVLMVSTDIHRPAARQQLSMLGEQTAVDVFSEGTTIKNIMQGALEQAKKGLYDVLLVDTAGRKHIDADMMDEIKNIHALAKPIENILVVDAMLGQESIVIAQEFHKATPLTGFIVTRIDGDARGGASLSIRSSTGTPIKFLGTGEKVDALETFSPDSIARRILGMGDTLSLIEKIMEQEGPEEEDLASPKDLNYHYLLKQMQKIGKLGGLKKLMQFLPNSMNTAQHASPEGEKALKRKIAIIQSMTTRERSEKDTLNFSRKKRIVLGSGTTIQEVNQLTKQLKTMRTMLKRFSKKGYRRH